jgi:predicted nucleotidyltransferase
VISEQQMVEFEQRLRVLVAELPGVRCAFIFGSWASRTLRDGSDLDLYLAVDDKEAAWDALDPVIELEQGTG